MLKSRKYMAIGGTVVSALAIGFVMQFGRDVPSAEKSVLVSADIATAPIDPSTDPETLVELTALDTETPVIPVGVLVEETPEHNVVLEDVTLTAATPPAKLPRALPDEIQPLKARFNGVGDLPSAPSDPDTPALGCTMMAQATPIQAAMIRVNVVAPCFPNERITVHHNGMMFTDATDENGMLAVDVPALSEHAIFILALANGKGAVAQAHVPTLAGFDRVALQWSGDGGFQIHAREYGASYGDQGHVWAGSMHSSFEADAGTGGFVTRLGDAGTLAPQLAEIYSFPTGAAQRQGTIALSVEAEVSELNCGRDVSAQVLKLGPEYVLQTSDLILSVPDCDAVGDFLVLNNLVDDLKIAGK